MKFDPEAYTIKIRKEYCDGDILYVGRVAEFPNISAFDESFDATRSLVIEAIQSLKKIADKTQARLPLPNPASLEVNNEQ
jgi:predicted RNase H-like HicB family nuclease